MKKLFKALMLSLSMFTMMSIGVAQMASSQGPEIVKKEAGGTDWNGWNADFSNGATGSKSIVGGLMTVSVTTAGTSDWHAKLAKYGTSAVAGGSYTITMVMKASKAIKANYIINDVTNGVNSATWWMDISTSFASYSRTYDPTANSSNVEYLLQVGGDSGWPSNVAGDFVITIEKIVISATTPHALFTENFSGGTGGFVDTYSDGAAGSLSSPSSNLVHNITSFGAGNIWNVQTYKNTGLNLTNGTRYRFDMDVSVTSSQAFEACFEDYRMSWEYRAGFNNGSWSTGTTHYSHVFTASTDLTGLYLHFQLGQASSASTITIDNVVFSDYVTTVDETRPGYYASEFATVLGSYDTCVASAETGYLAAPTLKANYYDKLIDASNLSTTYVTDYAYNLGEGTDPKTANAVTADVKWVAMVMMYNANNGGDPDLSLAGVAPTVEETSLFATTDFSTIIIIFVLGFNAIALYYFASKRKTSQQ